MTLGRGWWMGCCGVGWDGRDVGWSGPEFLLRVGSRVGWSPAEFIRASGWVGGVAWRWL
jgi:hypothetical protein